MKKGWLIALCTAALCVTPLMTALAEPTYGPGGPGGPGGGPGGSGSGSESTSTYSGGLDPAYATNPVPQPPAEYDLVDYTLPITVVSVTDFTNVWGSMEADAPVLAVAGPLQMYRYIDDADANYYHVMYKGQDAYLSKSAGYLTNTIKMKKDLGVRATVVLNAFQYLGTPYVYGNADPAVGFDCSGFTQYNLSTIGVSVPRSTKEQVKAGVPIDVSQIRPGDLVYYSSGGTEDTVNHVEMYIGCGRMIHAKNTANGICVDPYAMRMDAPFRITNVIGD